MRKNSGKSPHRLIGDEENEEESQRVQHFSYLFFLRHRDLDSEGTAAEMPPTKMWQHSGTGHQSKEDSKGPPWVEENLGRQQIPITHTIKSGACRYLILYQVTAEGKKKKKYQCSLSDQHSTNGLGDKAVTIMARVESVF